MNSKNVTVSRVNSATGNSTNPLNLTISFGHTPLTPYVKSNPKFCTQAEIDRKSLHILVELISDDCRSLLCEHVSRSYKVKSSTSIYFWIWNLKKNISYKYWLKLLQTLTLEAFAQSLDASLSKGLKELEFHVFLIRRDLALNHGFMFRYYMY